MTKLKTDKRVKNRKKKDKSVKKIGRNERGVSLEE